MKHLLRYFLISVAILCYGLNATAQVYSGTGGSITNDSLPNWYSINVSTGNTVIDYNYGLYGVMVNISHPFDGDLNIFLVAPNGVAVELSTKNGGSGDNYTSTIFTNQTTTKITAANPPYNGSFRPEASLSAVNEGQNPNGIWKLLIVDSKKNVDAGSLLNWSLIFSSNPSKPIAFTNSNLPLMIINTYNVAIPDEPKISGTMTIVNNDTSLNSLSDAANFYNHKIKIEARGSTSQNFPKRPYGFFTVDANGADSNTSLLGMPKEHSWVLNATYNDKSLMRDVLTYELARRSGRYATRWRYVELFINGKYEGIYVLMEKVKRDDKRVDIAKMNPATVSGDSLTGGYILKIDKQTGNFSGGWTDSFPTYPGSPYRVYFQHDYPEIAVMTTQQVNYIRNYVYLFENALYGSQFTNPVNGYRKYADIGSFIDLSIMNEISKNVDGYRLSTYLYKDRDSFGGKLTMGPIWDFNLAWNNADYNNSSDPTGWEIDISTSAPFWWKRLKQDSAYNNAYTCRWNQLRQSTLALPNIYNFLDSTYNYLKDASFRNFQRWPVLGLYVWPNPSPLAFTMEEEIINLKGWIAQRFAWMDSQLTPLCNNTMACKPKVAVFADKTTVCKNQSVKLSADGVGTAFTWSPSTGLNTIYGRNVIATIDTNRTYRVVMQTSNGCSDTAYISLNANPLPAKGVTGNTNICRGYNTTLTATSGAVSYKWSPTNTLDTAAGPIVKAFPQLSTTYKVVMRNAAGCSDSSYITVNVNPGPSLNIKAKKDSICLGETDSLFASGSATYRWLPGLGLSDTIGPAVLIKPTATTTYKMIGTTSFGCTDTASVTIFVYPKSFLQISSTDTVICKGNSANINGAGALYYNWLPANGFTGSTATNIRVNPTTTTTYRLIGINQKGCSDTTQITIKVYPKPSLKITASDTIICRGNSSVLTGSGADTNQWLPGNGLSASIGSQVIVKPSVTSTYQMIGKNNLGCADTTSITIQVLPLPSVKIIGDTILCTGNYTELKASGADSYSWYPPDGLNKTNGNLITATPATTTTYHAIGTGFNGCIDTATIKILVQSVPTVSITPNVANIIKLQSIPLNASGAKRYYWSPNVGLSSDTGATVIASPLTTTTYTVRGFDNYNCENAKTVTVNVAAVGIKHKQSIDDFFSIYPTPVQHGELLVKINASILDNAEYKLYDVSGKTLSTGKLNEIETKINLSQFSDGIYLIQIGDYFKRFTKMSLE